jgi:putative ATPase
MFYQPSDRGAEGEIRQEVQRRREAQLEAMREDEDRPAEILTFTRVRGARDLWLERAAGAATQGLADARERLFEAVATARHHLVLDLRAGEGLLTWEALRRVPEGGVWAVVSSPGEAAALEERAAALGELDRPHVLAGSLADLPRLLDGAGGGDLRFDAAVGRNCFLREPDPDTCLRSVASILRPGGKLAIAELLPARGQRLSGLLDLGSIREAARERLDRAEGEIYAGPAEDRIAEAATRAGLEVTSSKVEEVSRPRRVRPGDVERWFDGPYGAALARHLTPEELGAVRVLCRSQLAGKEVPWRSAMLFLVAEKPGA